MRSGDQHDPYAALRLPQFRRFLLAGQVVAIGTSAQSVAIGYDIYQRTGDALALGMVGLVQALPMLLLTLPAGYLADVIDRRKLIVAGMIVTCSASIGLAVANYFNGSIYLMYALLALDSCGLRLAGPARQALLPLIVSADRFESAVKWRTSLGQVSSVVGPALGGLIVWLSLPAAYLLSAGSEIVYIFMLMSITLMEGKRTHRGRMIRQVIEGVQFVWKRKIVLGAISLDLFAVLLGGATYLLPIFVHDVLDLGPTGLEPAQALGLLKSCPAVGALITALVLANSPPFKKAGRAMLIAVAGFGAATIVFGLSRNLWLSMAALVLTGVTDNVSVVIRHVLVQLSTPNEMRGRVSAVNSMFISSSNELGGFESGAVARLFGPVVSVVAGGVGTIAVVMAWAGLFPSLRKVGRLVDAQHHSPASSQ